MVRKNRGWITTLAILSVSLIICSGNAINPALPAIGKAFPSVSPTMIKMVGTIQQLAVLLALFISVVFAKKIGMKRTISLGLIFVGISGVLGALSGSFFTLVIISRLVLGIGVGFFNSLAIDIINIYYASDKAKRVKVIGMRSSCEPLGICVLQTIASYLVLVNWHLSFLIYLAAFPVLLFFNHYVPNVQTEDKNEKKHKTTAKEWKDLFSVSTIVLTLMMVFMCVVNTAVGIQIPFITKELHEAAMSGIVLDINTFTAMAIGLCFGFVFSKLHRFTLPFGMIFMAIGTLLIAIAHSIPVLIAGAIIVAFAFPLSGSFIYSWIGDAIPKRAQALITSVLLVGCNLGTFISPLVTGFLTKLGTDQGSMSHAFVLLSLISVIY